MIQLKKGQDWRPDAQIALEIASHEALVRQAYRDSEGVWTWCVGMTNATGHHVERYIDNPQTLEHCMTLFVWALTNYSKAVNEAFKDVLMTKAQYTAALSFHWNTGAIAKATWVERFREGNLDGAREAFMWYSKPSSIVGRRKKERDLFFAGKWSNNGQMLEYTRVKSNYTPDWDSGKLVRVDAALRKAFGDKTEVIVDKAPEPDAPVLAPTIGKGKQGVKDPGGITGLIALIAAAIVATVTAQWENIAGWF